MAQATNTGSRDDVEAQLQQGLAQGRPPSLRCNACQAVLTDVAALETRQLKGITQAFGAHCKACDQGTWAVRGEPAAVRAFYDALEKAAGQAVLLGTAKPASAS